MEIEYRYLFAEKNTRVLCIKYDSDWEMPAFNYLIDKGYKLRPASESHWNRQIDEEGSLVHCYRLDKDLERFDIGDF